MGKIDILFRWLESKNLLERYKQCIQEYSWIPFLCFEDYISDFDLDGLIDAFDWAMSEEGWDYWNEIDEAWVAYTDDIEL